jgi:hypothetical protein
MVPQWQPIFSINNLVNDSSSATDVSWKVFCACYSLAAILVVAILVAAIVDGAPSLLYLSLLYPLLSSPHSCSRHR